MIDIHITNKNADIKIAHEQSYDVLERLIATTAEIMTMCSVPLSTFAKVLLEYDAFLKNKED